MDNFDKWVGVVAVIYTVTLHELGHAYSATWLGDPTPGKHGRLTFNPIVQLHPIYSVLGPIMTYLWMGIPLGFAYCPIDPSRFKRPLRDQALCGVAGPLVNFAVALLCVGMLWIPFLTPPGMFNQSLFFGVGLWNALLGAFNLLPFPGLDGYAVIRPILPLSIRRPLDEFRRMGYLPLMVAILIGGRVFGYIFPYVREAYFFMLPSTINFGERTLYDMLFRWLNG